MNLRIEKLCLPRHRRDAIWKFWQPNAKLEKIYPPIYWKSLDYKQIHSKKKNFVKNSRKTHHQNERLCSDGCHYTTLIYKQLTGNEFHVFIDFEHNELQHTTWKELIQQKHLQIKTKSSILEYPWLNFNNKQQSLNDYYLKRQELDRYLKSHREKDHLFELDKTSYPNRPIPISRRPRDALHIDFYQATCLKGSKTEATFKTFYHRKYLLPRHLHEHTLKNLITNAINTQLDIEIIGHFILHPNELSKHEIQMFELTSEFGDIYEGHIIQINKEKLVLLLSSTYHSHIQISQSKNLKNIIDEPKSIIEQIILDHVREYFRTNNNYSIEQIRRIQIELGPLINQEKRNVIIHLLSDEEIIEKLTFEITYNQEPKLFDKEFENNLYFLQGIDEQTIIYSVENKLKQLFNQRYSLIHQKETSYLQLTFDMEYDTINSIEKMFYAYVNNRLSKYSREECMRIAIEYSFDDLLDKLDSNYDQKQIQMMMDDVQRRLRLQIEQRLKAEATAKILLIGPPMKKEIESTGKEVIVLDHHREIFINQSNTYIGSPKVKNIQRHNSDVIFHDEIDGGPKRFDRLPMSIDSLTILTRLQQRKDLAAEQNENNFILLGSGIRRLVTSEDDEQNISFSVECEQEKIEKKLSFHVSLNEEDDNSIETFNTTSINTKSYNKSAHTKQKDLKKFRRINQDHQQRKNKKISRSLAEHRKYKQKRKKYKQYESTSKILDNSRISKRSFFNNLFLLRQNKKQKMIKSIRNRDRKQKHIKSSNAITENSNTNSNDENSALKNNKNLQNNLFIQSREDLSCKFLISSDNRDLNMSLDEKEQMNDDQISNSNDIIINEKNFIDHKDDKHQKCNNINQLNDIDKSVEQQQFQDEGFQDKEIGNDDSLEASKKNYDTERYLRSLYGSLSSTTKHVHDMYQSKSSQLMASLDLAHIFITFLHIRKDIAHEIASTIITARERLIQPISTEKSSSSTGIDNNIISKTHMSEENDNDDASISSGIVTAEDRDTVVSENSSTSRSISDDDNDEDQNNFPDIIRRKKYNLHTNKNIHSSNSQHIMNRMISYLSETDWRVFNYITKHFLQNGTMITSHALEFSSALLMDLIDDSVYRTYFHLKWCSDSYINLNYKKTNEYIENTLIEEFFKKSIDNLFNHLQLINLPLLESIALMQTLKKYMSTDLLQEFNSMERHPVPIGRDPCIWFSTDILIKTICSLTDDILNKMNHDYLSDYTKLEYLLISYFRKIEIVHNLQDIIEKNQYQTKMRSSRTISNHKCLLHVIDLNQAPKFFSDQAFKRFKLGEESHLNGDIEALKDLVLLDIQKRNIKSVKRPYLPLSMNDLVLHDQNRVISPSPLILAQCHRQLGAQKTHSDKYNVRKDSYQFDETTDSTKIDNLPQEVRALLDNMIRNYGTIEKNSAMQVTQDQYEGLSEEDVAQLIENAIEAVERFDRENNIGDRKLQNKKTVNDRLIEFFKYAGRHGVRLLDDVLQLAKLRSNDPKKYLPLAVNMLKDRLKLSGTTRMRKQGVRFAHTLETLLKATNDEPELIKKMLKKKSEKKNLLISEKISKEHLTTDLDSSKRTTKEIDTKIDTSSIEPITDTNIPSYPTKMFTTNEYRQTLPIIDEAVESTIPSSNTTDIGGEFYPENLVSNPIISQIGLTVAQLIVLATGKNKEPLLLTNTQIKQICLEQGLPTDQLQVYVTKLMQITDIPDKFLLTEEQLVQIAIEEDISIAKVERIGTSQDNFQLNESQIRSLIVQINMVNCTSSTSTMPLEQQQLPLILHLDQLIELCNQQKIDIDKFLDNEITLQNSSLFGSSKLKFTLLPSQIAYLINQNKFDIRKLITIEQNLKAQGIQAQQFRLNSSQLAYLFTNHRIVHSHDIPGLSVAQLIGLYVLQQQSIKDKQTSLFSLTYQQIKQLALFQNMTLEHFQSLTSSKKPLQLTHNQLIYIAMENKATIKHIVSIHNDQKSKLLDREQLCTLVSQNNQPNTMQKPIDIAPSIDKSLHIPQRVCLNVEQIFSLAKYSAVKLHQLTTCATEHNDMVEFRFKPEQLATLWTNSISSDDLEHMTSASGSMSQFILSDEQFNSLLHSVSTSVLSTHSKSITTMKSNIESTSLSVPSLSLQLIKSNEPINITQASTDTQTQLPSALADQLKAMHERLQSSVQAHIETVKIVSSSILKRNRIESTLNLVHQLSLHSIDDLSNKEVETIPSFVLDLLKMNMMTENVYKSIEQGEITSDTLTKSDDINTKSTEIADLIASGNLNKTIIEGIQAHQLSFSQIHKIQTQLLTPKLMDEFKLGHLSPHILDAYKSLSPLQIINKVRSSVTQLNTLLLQQSSIISQSDTMVVPIMQQTATNNTIATDEIFSADASNVDKQISRAGHIGVLPQTNHQDPIIIYPESAIIRQKILQELRDRLDIQLIELKKEYGIEPIKGKASIQQITNKLRTMAITKDLESLIDRQIDEVDILNILEGHINHLLVQVQVDTDKTNELFDRNTQHRLNRINERIQLVNILQNHIENKRLKRQMNLEEFTALVLEDIPKFEQITNLHLTEDDLRILSMNRFASLERSITRHLTESEYRHLLQTNLPFDYIEQELLQRPLTTEERIEQEELSLLPYQELFDDRTSISYGKITKDLEQKNIKLTRAQLEQILQRRAELVDQYDIIHSISPSIKLIEEQLDRSLTIDEKKRLIHDDYSMIKPKNDSKYKDIKGKPQEILPITASLLQLIENTQDKNLLENIKQLEINLGRSLTKQEMIMVANGDIINLEKTLEKSLPTGTIKSMYNHRFIDLTNELNRNLTDKEIRDVLSGKLSGIEKSLGRQLTSTERLTYKPVNVIDLTASQLTNTPSIDTTVQELEDVLERRLTLHEIQYLTDQPRNLMDNELEKKVSIDKLNIDEKQQIHLNDSETRKNDVEEEWFIFGRIFRQPIQFTLIEIEKAIGKSLNSDELERFAGSRFAQIENDLGKSLSDLQRSNLLKGDKLTIENLINRKLSPEETGPHLVDIKTIERILNRSLTLDELTNLADDRFDEIHQILQRSFKQEELIDLFNGNYEKIRIIIEEELNKQKEKELKELPINRIQNFETILHRKLSSQELLRFAEDRFQSFIRLLSNNIKSEQILDLASGHYNKIETFFGRSLTLKEKYQLEKNLLQVHMKYSNILEELEYIIQRRLNEQELRILVGNQYYNIEMRLGKLLTEKQLRNILYGKYDHSLIEIEDLLHYLRIKYQDNHQRTRNIAMKLIEKLDQDYNQHQKESTIKTNLKSSSHTSSIQQKQSNIEFHQTTTELLEQLSDDVRKHAIVTRRDSLLDDQSISNNDELRNQEELLFDKKMTPISVSSSPMHQTESIKAFENITRIVEQIADQEHIEEMATVTNAIDKFQDVEKSNSNEPTSTWLSNLNKDTISPHLPAIKSIEDKPTRREPYPTPIHRDEDLHLGWTLFKGADRPDLGLKEEKPLMINVKHIAQTYVVGIPEEYADAKSKTIANKIYQGGSILYRLSKSRIIKEMNEFVSQLFPIPLINDATHFIVPSRAYIDIIEPMNIYQSELIDIEDDELYMRDSPETLEWYEECIQKNIQVHAQIPTDYQPSIVYCHTGHRTIITPAKRAEQRKASMVNSIEKSKTILNQSEPKKSENISTFNSSFIERLSQPIFDAQSTELTSTARTVTDLIMHTVTTSQKTDLLEALDELFSQENLEKYQMTETHWQDIFLILLNSYLRSHLLNRKEIFKRLTDKLHELRIKERRRSSGFYPSISIASPPLIQTPNSLNETDIRETKQKQFHFGLRSPSGSMNSGRTPNDSEYSITPATTGRQSIASHESILLPSNNNPSTRSLSQNHSAVPTSINRGLISTKNFHSRLNIDQGFPSLIEHVSKSSRATKSHISINSNTITEHQCPSILMKHRRYRITLMHTDELSDTSSNQCRTPMKSTKLPAIVSSKRSSQTKQSTSTVLTDNQLLPSSSNNKRIRTKMFSNFRKK